MSRLPQLDPRLLALARYVREDAVFADIGCDHGYLSLYLASERKLARGFACDISASSVEKARNNLAGAGLLDRVEPVLTDGLAGLEGKGITDILLAGMGGEVIARILEQAPWIKKTGIRLVLQPQSREAVLRRYLIQNGFPLLEETAVQSGRFVYCVICADYTGVSRSCTGLEAYGGLLPRCGTAEAADKLGRTAVYLDGLAAGASRSGDEEKARQLARIAEQLRGAIDKTTLF